MNNIYNKKIIIIEGPDGTGKTSLSNFIQNYVNGKCHILHSNYNKELPGENNFNQHLLITKFVCKQFHPKYYTGNNTIILDRNYISDIAYGTIGYGSKGDIHSKFKRLKKIFSIFYKTMLRDENLQVYLIYCHINNTKYFGANNKEELLNSTENSIIHKVYDEIFYPLLYANDNTENIQNLCQNNGIKLIQFNFEEDKKYENLIETIFKI